MSSEFWHCCRGRATIFPILGFLNCVERWNICEWVIVEIRVLIDNGGVALRSSPFAKLLVLQYSGFLLGEHIVVFLDLFWSSYGCGSLFSYC